MAVFTPGEMSNQLRVLVDALDAALARGLAKALTATNEAAKDNLRGGRNAAPWSYPVPRRTPKGLFNTQGIDKGDEKTFGYVLNNSDHAWAVHTGNMPVRMKGGGHRMVFGVARPFLDDAVKQADPLMVIQREVEGALQAWA